MAIHVARGEVFYQSLVLALQTEEEETEVCRRRRELWGKESDHKREEIFGKNLGKCKRRNFNINNLCGVDYFDRKYSFKFIKISSQYT